MHSNVEHCMQMQFATGSVKSPSKILLINITKHFHVPKLIFNQNLQSIQYNPLLSNLLGPVHSTYSNSYSAFQ